MFLVPGMTNNLVAVSALEDEGYDVIFSRGRVFVHKYDSNERIEIGIRDGGLYRLSPRLLKAFVHDFVSSVELWHRRLAHLHYRALPSLRKVVTRLSEFEEAFIGEKPKIGHLRIFGCSVYIHVLGRVYLLAIVSLLRLTGFIFLDRGRLS